MKKSSAVLDLPQSSFSDLELLLRERIQEVIETLLKEEVDSALGAGSYERGVERRGYRHGTKPARTIVTSLGPVGVEAPRARVRVAGGYEEFRSQVLPRYRRRTTRVDAAILSCYLAGANTRKVKLALRPLTEGTMMSKSAVSRVVKKLGALFEAWRGRDLSGERYPVLMVDAMRLPVRLARRVVKVPVQAVLGVTERGEKVLLDLRIAPSESLGAWQGVMERLSERGLETPCMVVLDGNKGLIGSTRRVWPGALVQRCTKHKYENLKVHCPNHAHEELKRDYRAITHAGDLDEARQAYQSFLAKWRKWVPEVAKSLEEGGEELLTFYRFPKAQWKSLRTTNMIERLNGEFRRRTKTQASFPNEEAALVLLYGLLASGVIGLRKIDGYRQMEAVIEKFWRKAA